MNNVERVAAHYEAGRRGDIDGMLAIMAEEIEWTEMEGGELAGVYRGRQQVLEQVFSAVNATWSDFRVEVDELLDAGDTVIALGRYSAQHRRTGKPVSARIAHVWRLSAGEAVAFEQFVDTALMRDASLS